MHSLQRPNRLINELLTNHRSIYRLSKKGFVFLQIVMSVLESGTVPPSLHGDLHKIPDQTEKPNCPQFTLYVF